MFNTLLLWIVRRPSVLGRFALMSCYFDGLREVRSLATTSSSSSHAFTSAYWMLSRWASASFCYYYIFLELTEMLGLEIV